MAAALEDILAHAADPSADSMRERMELLIIRMYSRDTAGVHALLPWTPDRQCEDGAMEAWCASISWKSPDSRTTAPSYKSSWTRRRRPRRTFLAIARIKQTLDDAQAVPRASRWSSRSPTLPARWPCRLRRQGADHRLLGHLVGWCLQDAAPARALQHLPCQGSRSSASAVIRTERGSMPGCGEADRLADDLRWSRGGRRIFQGLSNPGDL